MNVAGVAGAICTQCECPERARIPCDTSDLHAPCCAAQQLACGPGPKARRETRDANAEEATGEKQLLRLERPFQTAVATYNVIQNARGFLTKQVMRCRARLTAPLGRAQPPLSTTPYPELSRHRVLRPICTSKSSCTVAKFVPPLQLWRQTPPHPPGGRGCARIPQEM